ncbi:MAG: hypothetical protein ACTSQ8_25635, partial [Candidatus Helarchaeota archaeon]
MMIKRVVFLTIILSLKVFSYQWPMFDQYGNPDNKIVTSGFCAYRPQYNSIEQHFHAGIDIPEQENAWVDKLYIWPIDYGNAYYVSTEDSVVKIRHYNYESGQFTSEKAEGSAYRHAYPVCAQNEWLELDNPIAEGWNMYQPGNEHLHLEYRIPGTMADYKNPFTITELQIEDNSAPVLCSLYVDYSRQGDAVVACWEY